jgi:hypothetical protein
METEKYKFRTQQKNLKPLSMLQVFLGIPQRGRFAEIQDAFFALPAKNFLFSMVFTTEGLFYGVIFSLNAFCGKGKRNR